MTITDAARLLSLPEAARRVEYRAIGLEPERGTVMHVTANYVFVAYDGRGGGWWATSPEDLTLVTTLHRQERLP